MPAAKRSKTRPDLSQLVRMAESSRMATASASTWRCSGRVLGVDLALRAIGVCLLTPSGLVQRLLTIETQIDAKASQAQRTDRLLYIANEVVGIIKEFKPVYVGIEDYAYASSYQAHQIGEIGGTIKTQVALACSMYVRPAPIKSARKHVLGYGGSFGKGDEAKTNIMEVVRLGYGVDARDDHQADSFVVARYTLDQAVAEEKEMQEIWEKSKQETSR